MSGEKEKVRFVVNDGYSFIFLPQVKDRKGEIQTYPGRKTPALAGSILDLELPQIIGQEQKLSRVEAVIMKCNNHNCGKKFETSVSDLAYAWCPHCGGRGGDMLKIAPKKKAKKEKESKHKDRQDKEPEYHREEVKEKPKKRKKGKLKKKKD